MTVPNSLVADWIEKRSRQEGRRVLAQTPACHCRLESIICINSAQDNNLSIFLFLFCLYHRLATRLRINH